MSKEVACPVVRELSQALAPGRMRLGSEIPERNHMDASRQKPSLPLALVVPQSTEEVSQVVAICAKHNQRMVVQGGLTGLSGGGHPDTGEVAISLEKMSRIEEVDQLSGTMTVQAGAPLYQVQEVAEKSGWFYPVDLGARGSCTIGGNVATNAGGNQVLRYGMTRKQVLGLEVVLADGTVVTSLNKMLKNNAGYDWTQFFVGAEGTLGIITRVVLKLAPPIQNIRSAMLGVESTEKALAALRRLERDLPVGLLAFEAIWREFILVAEGAGCGTSPFSHPYDLNVLVEVALGSLDPDIFDYALSSLIDEGLVGDAVIAQSEAERRRFWSLRESSYEFVPRMPRGVAFDVSIPLEHMNVAIEAMRRSIPVLETGVLWIVFGHLADSNLHIRIFPRHLTEESKVRAERCVYGIVSQFGGSISAEHGIGKLKKAYLSLSRNPAELKLMAAVKGWLDPHNLLNPGRVLP